MLLSLKSVRLLSRISEFQMLWNSLKNSEAFQDTDDEVTEHMSDLIREIHALELAMDFRSGKMAMVLDEYRIWLAEAPAEPSTPTTTGYPYIIPVIPTRGIS